MRGSHLSSSGGIGGQGGLLQVRCSLLGRLTWRRIHLQLGRIQICCAGFACRNQAPHNHLRKASPNVSNCRWRCWRARSNSCLCMSQPLQMPRGCEPPPFQSQSGKIDQSCSTIRGAERIDTAHIARSRPLTCQPDPLARIA
jgi:hypothetical protein